MTTLKQLCRGVMFDPKFYLALAALIVLLVTLAPNPTGNGKPNLVPLRNSGGPVDLLGNIGLFLPLGVLASIVLERKMRLSWARILLVFGAGVLFSALIETAQAWLPTRSADVDDIIFNACGALLGAMSVWSKNRTLLIVLLTDPRWYRVLPPLKTLANTNWSDKVWKPALAPIYTTHLQERKRSHPHNPTGSW